MKFLKNLFKKEISSAYFIKWHTGNRIGPRLAHSIIKAGSRNNYEQNQWTIKDNRMNAFLQMMKPELALFEEVRY